MTLLRFIAISTLLAIAIQSFAGNIPVTGATKPPVLSPADVSRLRLCAKASTEATLSPQQNPTRVNVQDMLKIVPAAISIHYRSDDWKSLDEVSDRTFAILHARPRILWPSVVWSEGANFALDSFVADVINADGTPRRLEVSGYQVCIYDAAGRAWLFRNVVIDLWP